ncbi:MAG: polysaccharide deacetylase family protein [Bacteroidota bacterium]
MKNWILILFLTLSLPSLAQEKTMCITVDDLPTVTYGEDGYYFQLGLIGLIVAACDDFDAPAIGYVNERKLYRDGELNANQVSLLQEWLGAGLELGNHTYSHPSYHKTDFEEFTADILKGEQVIKPLAASYGMEVRYFRHPFLHVGKTAEEAQALEEFLEENGYTIAPVTIDNAEYLFALAYARAYDKDDVELMRKIGRDYVDYMEAKLVFFEQQSVKLFDRNIAQTLLIHSNWLNAHYLAEVLKVYAQHGYTFVSQEEVLQDPAYQTEITTYGDYGISWLDRWALSQGKKGDFFEGDPEVPAYVVEMTR